MQQCKVHSKHVRQALGESDLAVKLTASTLCLAAQCIDSCNICQCFLTCS
jgi:hypothetical protein